MARSLAKLPWFRFAASVGVLTCLGCLGPQPRPDNDHSLGGGEVADTSGPQNSAGAPAGFVLIPAGDFMMGSPTSEPDRYDDENQHEVRITRAFYLQKTEVTQGEWKRLMGNNPSLVWRCGDQCPVENVSWWDAVAYANALSKKEGKAQCYQLSSCSGSPGDERYECGEVSFVGVTCGGYRLPTEAEWEYAARAGNKGERYGEVGDVAWYAGNSDSEIHPVGKKRANAWGLFDMLGNVWEWNGDWAGAYEGATDPVGPDSGSGRVYRGGCWSSAAGHARAANRGRSEPGFRGASLGFRLAGSAQ